MFHKKKNTLETTDFSLKNLLIIRNDNISPANIPSQNTNATHANEDVSLRELYDTVFETRLATTAKDLEAAYRLRYQVYCIENNFEDPDMNPDEQEFDEFDENSITALLIHRHTGFEVGTFRLVLPKSENPDNCFPIQSICNLKALDPKYDPLKSVEISRFCISKQMRKRVSDTSQYPGHPINCDPQNQDALTKRTIPYAALGLIKAIFDIGQERGYSNAYASMEPFLIRSLSMLGIPVENIGPMIDYHGKRYPTKLCPLEIYEKCRESNYRIYEYLISKPFYI